MSEAIQPVKRTPLRIFPSSFFDSPNPKAVKGSYMAVIFYLLMDAMTIRQNTVITDSQEIEANAALQDKLNNANASIQFSILQPGAKTATINKVQDQNEQYAAIREDIQNSLITARQTAQVMMTQASTKVNMMQQDASEDTGMIDLIKTVFDQITDI